MTLYRIAVASSLFAGCLGCGSNKPARIDSPQKQQVGVRQNSEQTSTESTDPAEIIRAAIEAHGGEANFAKADVGQTMMTIDGAFQPGVSGHFTKLDIFHFPGKLKRIVTGRAQGQQFDLTVVVNDDKAWMQANRGEPTAIPIVNPNQVVYQADNLSVLVALKESEFNLSVLPADDISERPVQRLRMETAGKWIGDSFFDKETHLLVASKKEIFDPSIGKSRKSETYYSAYKNIDGLNLPMSIEMVMDGETIAKITVTEVKFMDKINEDVFAKPVVGN